MSTAITGGNQLLESVKVTLGVRSSIFDDEITDLINAARSDLGLAGITENHSETDALIILAIKTYCRMNFHNPANYDKLKASYDEQKAQLQTAEGYTNWLED